MDKDKLVEVVLKKVLEELLERENDKILTLNTTEKLLKKIPVLNYLGDDKLLKDELKKQVKIIDGIDLKTKFEDIKHNNETTKILISSLCIKNLINLSQGKKNIVIECLLNGGEVYLIEEGLEYKKYLEPKALIKLYDEYLEKIKTYGIKLIKRNDALHIFQQKEEIYIDGIITETKLKEQNLKNKVIILKRNNKITSLAQDYIKQNNIEVHYERGQ